MPSVQFWRVRRFRLMAILDLCSRRTSVSLTVPVTFDPVPAIHAILLSFLYTVVYRLCIGKERLSTQSTFWNVSLTR